MARWDCVTLGTNVGDGCAERNACDANVVITEETLYSLRCKQRGEQPDVEDMDVLVVAALRQDARDDVETYARLLRARKQHDGCFTT